MVGYTRRALSLVVGCFILTGLAVAQSDSPGLLAPAEVVPATETPATPVPGTPEDKRIFGVLPNYRTAEAASPFAPLSAKQKFTIAFKDSFDWPVYPTAAAFATLYQLENQNPSFGQGMPGYATRVAAAYGDQMIGNMMTEGIVPSLLHQDPRYFRLGEGSVRSRAWYAVTRIFVARTDSGRNTFNFAEWGGNAAAVALSNAWYPDTQRAEAAHSVRHRRFLPSAEGILARREAAFPEEA